jgi:hypothetical protein
VCCTHSFACLGRDFVPSACKLRDEFTPARALCTYSFWSSSDSPMRSKKFKLSPWFAACGVLVAATMAVAQQPAAEEVSPRLREEASRPLRWIIESAKLDRKRGNDDKPKSKGATVPARAEAAASVASATAVAARPAGAESPSQESVAAFTPPPVVNRQPVQPNCLLLMHCKTLLPRRARKPPGRAPPRSQCHHRLCNSSCPWPCCPMKNV